MTNSQAASHVSWLVRYSPHPSRFSLSIQHYIIAGGSPVCFDGSSLAVKLLAELPTPDFAYRVDSSLTDFNTGTSKNPLTGTTVYQQALLSPRCYLVGSRQIPCTSFNPKLPSPLSL